MTRNSEVGNLIDVLTGLWVGHGSGGYPTIDSFAYRESMRFTRRDDHPSLLFEQRTWKDTPDGEVVSHWETGLLRISSDRSVLFNNAQPGRVESMTGEWAKADGQWEILLHSTSYAGDNRVIESSRTFRINDERLEYRMLMHTTATDQLLVHLEAVLERPQ